MLRDEIREFMSMYSCRTLQDLISRAREHEIDLELLKKKKSVRDHTAVGQVKRPQTQFLQLGDHQSCNHNAKCRRTYEYNCCGKGEGLLQLRPGWPFQQGFSSGFRFNLIALQPGWPQKARFLRLASGVVMEPALSTLRITNGHEGRVELPVVMT